MISLAGACGDVAVRCIALKCVRNSYPCSYFKKTKKPPYENDLNIVRVTKITSVAGLLNCFALLYLLCVYPHIVSVFYIFSWGLALYSHLFTSDKTYFICFCGSSWAQVCTVRSGVTVCCKHYDTPAAKLLEFYVHLKKAHTNKITEIGLHHRASDTTCITCTLCVL